MRDSIPKSIDRLITPPGPRLFHILSLTSKQYPNSTCSFSPGCANKPCAAPRLRVLEPPRNPTRLAAAPLGPKTRPARRYATVEVTRDVPMKWTKTNRSEMRTIEPKLGEYA